MVNDIVKFGGLNGTPPTLWIDGDSGKIEKISKKFPAWQMREILNPGNTTFYEMCRNSDYLFVASYRSTDSKSYIYRMDLSTGIWTKTEQDGISLCRGKDDDIWCLTSDKKLYKSTDNCSTFTLINTFAASANGIQVRCLDDKIVCLFGPSVISYCYHSEDYGSNWSGEVLITMSSNVRNAFFTSTGKILATSRNGMGHATFGHSDDNGATWSETQATTYACVIQAYSSICEKNGKIYLSTADGAGKVWISTDDGETFTEFFALGISSGSYCGLWQLQASDNYLLGIANITASDIVAIVSEDSTTFQALGHLPFALGNLASAIAVGDDLFFTITNPSSYTNDGRVGRLFLA